MGARESSSSSPAAPSEESDGEAEILTDGGQPDHDAITHGRVTVQSDIMGDVSGQMNFLSPTVDIEVSGAEEESGDVSRLHEELREAVAETIREFEPSEYEEVRR